MWRRLSDRIKGEEASLKQKSFTWHRAGCRSGVSSGKTCKKASKEASARACLTFQAFNVIFRHCPRKKASGVNCQSRKVINFRYENCYRLTIMDSLSRYIKVNVQLLFYTVVMHHRHQKSLQWVTGERIRKYTRRCCCANVFSEVN